MLNLLPRVILPHEIVIKKGSIIRLKYLEGKRAIIICSSNLFPQTENYQKVLAYLSAAKFEVNIIKMPSGDPTYDSVNKLISEMNAFRPDTVIAIGGGSIMDISKMARLHFDNNTNTFSGSSQNLLNMNKSRETQLILIPTTCGSGSEASSVAVLREKEISKKIPFIHNSFIPDIVILDPTLLNTLPLHLTVSTAVDALTHALESFSSKLSNVFSESYSRSAAHDIRMNLEDVFNPEKQILCRERLQVAAFNAGIAQNISSVGASHAFAHSLGAFLNIPHGVANGIFLTSVLKFNALFTPKVAEILKEIGFNEISDFENWLGRILTMANLPRKWGIYMSESNTFSLEDIAKVAYEDLCMKTNPKKLSIEEIISILQETL